ncbi:MAG: hypothetical protein H8E84_03120 [Flavobacteriales bacterium]|nr:hypothetical protein [Flavobacteriales bacterium]
MKSLKIVLLFILILIFFLFKKFEPENKKINIYRFEKSLFETNSEKIEKDMLVWEKELGTFFESFNHEVLRTNSQKQTYQSEILNFVSHPDMREAYDTVVKKYPNLDFLESDLADAFDRYNQHFPKNKIPTVITYFSGFNFGVVTNDTILAIGLDYFLGKQCYFYKHLYIPEYMMLQSQENFIVPYCIEAIVNNEFGIFDIGNDFLSQMIFKGKIMYFIDVMLPKYSNADKLRFSKEQLSWCKENEKNIWASFIDNEILYSTDVKKFNSYLNFSPFAKRMPKESPGRIAYWMGWQIVADYMESNPNLTLEELIQNTQSQEILQQSGYKP